ncbi:hypothetical protein D9M68_876100 [compost metagenome]
MAQRKPQAIGRRFEDFCLQRVAILEVRNHHHGDVQFAADQQMFEIVPVILDRRHLHRRIGTPVARQQFGQHIAGHQ